MANNPDPAHITPASWWFMEQLLALEPDTENSGIYTNKPGYHNTRDQLLAQGLRGDYSIQLAADKLGPGGKAAAYDWTFRTAQRGDYSRIMLYGQRIAAAYLARDPRLRGWREVLVQADPDLQAEGYDFAGWYTRTPDGSHLWHMHLSELRQHLESYDTKRAMLSVLSGQSLAEWQGGDVVEFIQTKETMAAGRVSGFMVQWATDWAEFEKWRGGAPVVTLTTAQVDARHLVDVESLRGAKGDPGPATLVPHTHGAAIGPARPE